MRIAKAIWWAGWSLAFGATSGGLIAAVAVHEEWAGAAVALIWIAVAGVQRWELGLRERNCGYTRAPDQTIRDGNSTIRVWRV